MTTEWASSALQSLQEIYSEAALLSSSAALAVLHRLLDQVDGLSSSPLSGAEGRLENTRELPVSTTPLVISYRISGDVIQVLAILQGAAITP
jgi:plasmid stabilization system protein ParE